MAFEGDMLMQGTHDNVIVTLLSETVVDTKVFKSAIFSADEIREYTKKQEASAGPSTVCFYK